MEPSRLPRSPAPRLVFLFATLTLTCAATGLLCAAIMSDHWEEVYWDKDALEAANVSPVWLLNGKVGRLDPLASRQQVLPHHQQNEQQQQQQQSRQQQIQQLQMQRGLGAGHHVVLPGAAILPVGKTRQNPAFLVPMHGGIWTMCVSLTDEEIQKLAPFGFPQERCINYLRPDEAHEEMRAAWQNRMQNLSISCSLVCLIILGCAVFVGFFGLCRHQISAVLVTGVMYLLAATFALFTLSIIHCKRSQDRANPRLVVPDGPEDGVVGGPVERSVLKSRRFLASWSMDFGWGGVTLSALSAVAWILLSKIMRFSPISAMIA